MCPFMSEKEKVCDIAANQWYPLYSIHELILTSQIHQYVPKYLQWYIRK